MRFFWSIWVALLIVGAARGETRFTVATYNLENYHLRDFGNRKAKPPEARAKVVAHRLARLCFVPKDSQQVVAQLERDTQR